MVSKDSSAAMIDYICGFLQGLVHGDPTDAVIADTIRGIVDGLDALDAAAAWVAVAPWPRTTSPAHRAAGRARWRR